MARRRRLCAGRPLRRPLAPGRAPLGGDPIAPLRICVPLGTLLGDSLAALRAAGVDVGALESAGRRLIVESGEALFITTRPADVPIYVEAGAADVGIVGKDVLAEREPDVYELADLGFGHCRMVYATRAGEDPTPAVLERLGAVRVATKYARIATRFFAASGRQAEVVRVNGSVELAPLVGLAHGIVDLVQTGTTLRENGLVEREEILQSSARLIANRVSHKVEAARIDDLQARLTAARG